MAVPTGIVSEFISTVNIFLSQIWQSTVDISQGSNVIDYLTYDETVTNISWRGSGSGHRPRVGFTNDSTALYDAIEDTHSVYIVWGNNVEESPLSAGGRSGRNWNLSHPDTRPSSLSQGTEFGFIIADSGQADALILAYVNADLTDPDPTVSISTAAMTVNAGAAVSLDATVANADSQSWVANPDAGNFADSTAVDTTWTAPRPTVQTTYTLTLTATGGTMSTSASVQITVRAEPNAPSVSIASPSQTIAAGGSVSLNATAARTDSTMWSATPDAGSFADSTAVDTTWTAPRPTVQTTYTLTLTGVKAGFSDATASIQVTVRAAPVNTNVVTNLRATTIYEDEITIVWTDSPNSQAVSYRVFVDGIAHTDLDPGVETFTIGPDTGPALEANTNYAIGVRMTSSDGTDFTDHQTVTITVMTNNVENPGGGGTTDPPVTPDPDAPPSPTNVRIVNPTASTLTLEWDDAARATYYEVRGGTGSGALNVGNVNEYVFTGLQGETRYTLEVRAANAGGESAFVAVIGRTSAAAPRSGAEPPGTICAFKGRTESSFRNANFNNRPRNAPYARGEFFRMPSAGAGNSAWRYEDETGAGLSTGFDSEVLIGEPIFTYNSADIPIDMLAWNDDSSIRYNTLQYSPFIGHTQNFGLANNNYEMMRSALASTHSAYLVWRDGMTFRSQEWRLSSLSSKLNKGVRPSAVDDRHWYGLDGTGITRPSTLRTDTVFYFFIASSSQSAIIREYCRGDLGEGNSSITPSGLQTSSISRTGFTANWALDATVTGVDYEVELCCDNAATRTTYTGRTTETKTETGLMSNTAYRWRVRAFDADTTSAWSKWQSVITDPPLPEKPSPSVLTIGNTYLEYAISRPSSVQIITRYIVQWSGSSNFASSSSHSTHYLTGAITGLTNGQTYYVRYRAVAESGDLSPWSDSRSAVPDTPSDPLRDVSGFSVSASNDIRLWADIFDANNNRLGDGPITSIINVGVSRSLDRIPDWTMSVHMADRRAHLLVAERRIKIYAAWYGKRREVVHGIIRTRNTSDAARGPTIAVSGQGVETELKRRNVLPGRAFHNRGLSAAITELSGLTNWALLLDHRISDIVVNIRFDGTSVLRALQSLNEYYGIHLRTYPGRRLYVSKLGRSSGLRINRIENLPSGELDTAMLMPAPAFSENVDSGDIFNRIYVQGGGEDAATLTLEHATKNSPYPIRRVTVNRAQHYYIEDTASIARYGLIEKLVQFKDITPVNNLSSAVQGAANLLYDSAVEYLRRYRNPVERFTANILPRNQYVWPGDTINVRYKANIISEGKSYPYLNVNGTYWIMRVNEGFSQNGHDAQIEIQNVDRAVHTAGEIVMSAVDSIDTRDLKPSIANSGYIKPFESNIKVGDVIDISIEITESTLYLHRARIRLQTAALDAIVERDDSVFELTRDTVYPGAVRVSINGFDRTAVMFKPDYDPLDADGTNGAFTLVPSAAPLDVIYEGSEILEWLESAPGGLIGNHLMQITCGNGAGRVSGSIEVYQTVQSINLVTQAVADDTGTRPGGIGGVQTTQITATSFRANWNGNGFFEMIDSSLRTITGTTVSGRTFTGLTPHSNYQWRVAGVSDGLHGNFSAWQFVQTLANAPPAPAAPTLSPQNGALHFAINPPTHGELEYDVQWKLASAGNFTNTRRYIHNGGSITGLTNGTAYDVRCRAVIGAIVGAWSASSRATPARQDNVLTVGGQPITVGGEEIIIAE